MSNSKKAGARYLEAWGKRNREEQRQAALRSVRGLTERRGASNLPTDAGLHVGTNASEPSEVLPTPLPRRDADC